MRLGHDGHQQLDAAGFAQSFEQSVAGCSVAAAAWSCHRPDLTSDRQAFDIVADWDTERSFERSVEQAVAYPGETMVRPASELGECLAR